MMFKLYKDIGLIKSGQIIYMHLIIGRIDIIKNVHMIKFEWDEVKLNQT